MCTLIKFNLELCRIDEIESELALSDAQDYLRRVTGQRRDRIDPWNIVFFDPPYADDYLPILESFSAQASSLLTESGLLIVEHHHKNQLPEEVGNLNRTRVLKQGDSALSFYEPGN